jgi:hypothetical protein
MVTGIMVHLNTRLYISIHQVVWSLGMNIEVSSRDIAMLYSQITLGSTEVHHRPQRDNREVSQ